MAQNNNVLNNNFLEEQKYTESIFSNNVRDITIFLSKTLIQIVLFSSIGSVK